MSRNIFKVIGKEEFVDDEARLKQMPKYRDGELYLTVFSGGTERGRSLQITILNNGAIGHIQLSNEQAKALAAVMRDWENAPEIEDKYSFS